MRLLGASLGGGIEQFRQRTAKIDGCSRQNPAYRYSRKTPVTFSYGGYFIIKLLKPYAKKYNGNCYFLTGNYKYIEPRMYNYIFKQYLKDAEINDINFHALRHTFATRAIEKGIDIKSLSEILGHSTVNMTLEKYVHPSLEQKRKQINKLNLLYSHVN